ncbi:MAG: hypothetical protein GC159_21850 [Phycisphaera sp.]|nr:hypothetical protein [Phycisphaera sp.]
MTRRMILNLAATCTLVTLALLVCGCATGEQVREADAGYPQPLKISLFVSTPGEQRYVYYIVERNGTLQYAGGRDANLRQAEDVGRLKDDQLRYLWQIIDRYGLLDGKGDLFPKGDKVYEVELTAGGRTARYNTAKDKLAGLDHLDKALFKMQGDIRYGKVDKAIEEKIERSGGGVQKK